MKILVDRMPEKKEACLFYKEGHCGLNNKLCSFRNRESVFGGECRCLKVNLASLF